MNTAASQLNASRIGTRRPAINGFDILNRVICRGLLGWSGRAPHLSSRGIQEQVANPMISKPKAQSAAVATLGVDIGKTTFHLIGLDERGAIVPQPPPHWR
jgi:hypothetical protein